MSFADYQRKVYYHNKRINESFKNSWENARFLAYNILLPYGVKGTPQSVFPFNWDNENVTKVKPVKMTQENINKLIEMYGK